MSATRVLQLVGPSDSGKTTLLLEVAAMLSARGRRVAYFKHHHDGAVPEKPRSDTERLAHYCIGTVLAEGPGSFVLRADVLPERLLPALGEALGLDWWLVEGYKSQRLGLRVFTGMAAPGPGDEMLPRAAGADWLLALMGEQ